MPVNEEMMKEMDEAAKKAEEELKQKIDVWTARDLVLWWTNWYMISGHKRLGRILVSIAKSRAD
jgi:hypothetical protein